MRGKRLVPLLFALVGLLAVAEPVAAAGYSSTTEAIIRGLNSKLLAVAIAVTVLVEGILVYTVWKFRNAEEAQSTKENRRLEITWTVATALVLLFVGVGAYGAMGQEHVVATEDSVQQAMETGNPVVVEATGQQFLWQFTYPNQNVSTSNTMVIPVGREIVIKTTSKDVIHSFHVPELALKADAFPGQYNYIQTRVTETGTYQLYCAEFCGAGHSQMLGTVKVVSQEEYQQWLAEQKGGSAGGAQSGSGGNQTASA